MESELKKAKTFDDQVDILEEKIFSFNDLSRIYGMISSDRKNNI